MAPVVHPLVDARVRLFSAGVMPPLDHARLRDTVHAALAALPWAHALWEGGSTAFGRADEWSDVDLQVDVDDAKVAETFAAVEAALAEIATVDLVYVVPEPAWHGHSQRFYRFADAPSWLMLDLCVIRQSNPGKFIEPELHGNARVLFDRTGLFGQPPRVDRAAMEQAVRAKLAALTVRFELFQPLVTKEIWREHPIDAWHFYQGLTLAPLITLLRMQHDPLRYDWSARYLHHLLPKTEADKLTRLSYVGSAAELPARQTEAVAWFRNLANSLKARSRLIPER